MTDGGQTETQPQVGSEAVTIPLGWTQGFQSTSRNYCAFYKSLSNQFSLSVSGTIGENDWVWVVCVGDKHLWDTCLGEPVSRTREQAMSQAEHWVLNLCSSLKDDIRKNITDPLVMPSKPLQDWLDGVLKSPEGKHITARDVSHLRIWMSYNYTPALEHTMLVKAPALGFGVPVGWSLEPDPETSWCSPAEWDLGLGFYSKVLKSDWTDSKEGMQEALDEHDRLDDCFGNDNMPLNIYPTLWTSPQQQQQ